VDGSKSAYKATFGPFDHNKTPLAPPGCKVLIHEKPEQRRSWDPHGVKRWYLGPAMEHYQCHQCYVTNMQAECISNTVEFFSKTSSYTNTHQYRRGNHGSRGPHQGTQQSIMFTACREAMQHSQNSTTAVKQNLQNESGAGISKGGVSPKGGAISKGADGNTCR
jgi:hypothetical protein